VFSTEDSTGPPLEQASESMQVQDLEPDSTE
jgi:hypothetical protein